MTGRPRAPPARRRRPPRAGSRGPPSSGRRGRRRRRAPRWGPRGAGARGPPTRSATRARRCRADPCDRPARAGTAVKPRKYTRRVNVLVVGSGAREHALAWRLAQSASLTELHAAPGNPGIAKLGRCHPVRASDGDGLLALALTTDIDLAVIGPEAPLV